MTEQGRRGRPWKVCSSGKQKVLAAVIDEVAEIPMVEVSLERGSTSILFEARGSIRALTRASTDFLIVKQVGVVPNCSEEEAN